MTPEMYFMCKRKRRYKSRQKARKHCKSLMKLGEIVHIYECPYCKGFHIGHWM